MQRPIQVYVCHLAFLLSAVMACLLYEERLLMDAAYYLFWVVNEGAFHVEHNRFILIFSQILPLMGMKLQLSLKSILILHSLNNVLFYYGLFLLCTYLFRHYWAGLALLGIQFIGMYHGYFNPMFEGYYGGALMALLFVMLQYRDKKAWHFLVMGVLTVFILTSHPMALPIFLLVLLLAFLDFRDWRYLGFIPLIAGVFIYKKLFPSSYEQEKMGYLLEYFSTRDFDFLQPAYLWQLAKYLTQHYWEVLVLAVGVIVFYVRSKKWWQLAAYAGLFLAILFIINGFYYGLAEGRYMEQVYFSWVLLTLIVFAIDVLPKLPTLGKTIWGLVFFVMLSLRALTIGDVSETFTLRVQHMKSIAHLAEEQWGGSKFVWPVGNMERFYCWGNWSYSMETILLTAAEGPDKAIIVNTDEDYESPDIDVANISPDELIYSRVLITPYSELNPRYFQLQEGEYKHLVMRKLLGMDHGEFAKQVQIEILQEEIEMCAEEWAVVPVRIINGNDRPLTAHRDNGIVLSYHWYQNDQQYKWNGEHTPLEIDITDTHEQLLQVRAPGEPGQYKLVVDIVGDVWFGIDEPLMVEVERCWF